MTQMLNSKQIQRLYGRKVHRSERQEIPGEATEIMKIFGSIIEKSRWNFGH